jgi:PAS domain S-box-containing protein
MSQQAARRLGSVLLLSILILATWLNLPANGSRAQAASTPAGIPLDRALRFERYTLEDGLSQNTVFALLQDRQGFLWIGTQDGLDRYDGYEFTVFKNDPQNANSLSLSSVIALYEDRQGMLWIGTWGGGLNRYDPHSGQFTRYQNNPDNPASLGNDIVTAIREDRQNRLWVGTCGGGLNLLDRQTGKFTRYQNDPHDPESLSSDNISTIFEDSTGGLWIGTGCYSNAGAGLNRLDPNSGKFVRYRNDPKDLASLSSDNIAAIVQDASGALWIGTGGYTLKGAGINRLDPQTGQARRYQHDPQDPASLGNDDIMGLMIDSSGVLWASTWGSGLDLANLNAAGDGAALHFTHQRNNPYDPQSLSSDIAWALLEDRSGVFWVGTGNGGLDKLNPQVQRFGLYHNDPSNSASLSRDAVGPVLEDSHGRIWVGTLGGGLERFNRSTDSFINYAAPESDPLSEQANTYLALYEDRDGTLWTGSLAGLGRFDPASGQTTYYRNDPADPTSLANDNITAIRQDRTGRLWVGTLVGLDRLDPVSRAFTHMQIPGLDSVFCLYLDTDGALWVGTWGQGVFRLDPQTVSGGKAGYTRYVHDPENPASLADNGVISILRDRSGTLWLGTQAGLDRFDPATHTMTHFQESNGLANNTVLCMLEDSQSRLWISTNRGLSRFDPRDQSFRNFYAHDGLQSNEFDSGACALSRAGEMYFGGQHGLNVFRPEAILDNPLPPPVAITAFRIFNEPASADLSGETPIQLSYNQNFVAFDFVALDFHAPQQNQYAYKLEGFDKDWVMAGTRRYASYTNLPGGNYVFRVKASNNDGVWNEDGAAVSIHIVPPIWQTWWFQAAGVLGLLAVLVLGVRLRLENVQTHNRRLEGLVGQRTQELSEANQQLAVEVEQRKLAEEALAQKAAEDLHQSEARFRAIFDNAAVGMALMTLDRHVVEINHTAEVITGYSVEEMRLIDPAELALSEDRYLDREMFQELISGQRDQYQVEKRYRCKDGGMFWGRLNYSLVRGANDKPLFVIGLIEDITEEKQAKEQLAAQDAEYRRTLEQRVAERTAELSMTNQQLQDAIQQRQKAEAALAQKAADEAVVAERTRLARDLHDAVTQTLFSASLIAEVLPQLWEIRPEEGHKRLNELRELTRGALAEMRTLLLELRPSALTDAALPDLLRQLSEAIIGRARLPIQLSVEGNCALPPEVQVALYRIAQEALNNVAKYARATQVSVNLRLAPDSARLTVIDDGVGFDLAAIPPNHLGLRIMRERAEAIGARLNIYSEPGEGTQVTVLWEKPATAKETAG